MEFGKKLNPERSLRKGRGIKGLRQKVSITHNPSEIGENQTITVRFPNLGSDDVIIPGTANLSFDITLNSAVDTKRTLVDNIGRAIVKKLAVKFEGNEILSIDDYDVFACYRDLWKTKYQKRDAIRQGVIIDGGCTENTMKLRIDASDKDKSNSAENNLAHAYKNTFVIPLDFEMLTSTIPYYQAGLGNRLCYEITFNYHKNVIKSIPPKSSSGATQSPDATYRVSNISLEYDIVTQQTLAKNVSDEYQNLALMYDRVLRHRMIEVNKSDTTWNWSFNSPCKSLKGIMVLFEEEKEFQRNTAKFYNPKINKVSVIVEGKPNQLFAQGMKAYEQYREVCQYFSEEKNGKVVSGEVQKGLRLFDMTASDFYNYKYALWLDFRIIDENELHGTGR